MKHHTFICGTSKSKEKDAYYIYHKDRFWGSIYEAGITNEQIAPEDYRKLGQKYGIYLTEIVDPDEYRVKSDSDIQPHQVRTGMERLLDQIQAHEPNRIAFVGKNAATWFYRFCENRELTHSQASGHKRDRRSIGEFKLGWDYLGLDYYRLSNTHRHWNKDLWLDFWDICREDVSTYCS